MSKLETFHYQYETFEMTCIRTGIFKENCYIIRDLASKNILIIDPGDDIQNIEKCVDELNGNVAIVILTHGHFDHVGALAETCETYNVLAQSHEKERKLIRRAGLYSFPFCGKKIKYNKDCLTYFTDDDKTLSWAGGEIDIIPTPGHTTGSVCFNFKGCIFTGDTLFMQYIGNTNLPESDHPKIITSIDKLLKESPSDGLFFPGHGKPWHIAQAQVWWSKVRDHDIPVYNALA